MHTLNLWLYWIIYVAYIITIISCVVIVLKENRNPIRSLSWVMALILLPGAGLVVYIFFGRSLRGERMISRRSKRKILNVMRTEKVDLNSQPLAPALKNLAKLANTLSSSVYTVNNEVEIFFCGKDKFESLRRDLKAAKSAIYFQYYIFQDDKLGHEIADILISKAQEGVDVRVIYDHVGSFSARNRFFKRMNINGVKTHPFFKVNFPHLASRINWRNHRKVVIIDNQIGYIGGMNIADRYEDGFADGHEWRDTHFRVKGEIVESLLYSFVVDWNFKNQPNHMQFVPAVPVDTRNHIGMQLVTSGPTSNWDNLALCFLKAISGATRRIYIQTPYFLPTDALQHALEAAALANIDVRIMIPGKSDSRMLQLATYSYLTQCLKAGIKVYIYTPGMLHSKAIIIDNDLVTVGSTNFDYRSFENNFECNLLIYDEGVNYRMREQFFKDIKLCKKLTFAQWRQRPLLQRILESIVRLISPIL